MNFRNNLIFYSERSLAPRGKSKLQDHPLSTLRDYVFVIFAATLISGGHLLHLQPEDAPYCGDKVSTELNFWSVC
jgi:hypothetical protein